MATGVNDGISRERESFGRRGGSGLTMHCEIGFRSHPISVTCRTRQSHERSPDSTAALPDAAETVFIERRHAGIGIRLLVLQNLQYANRVGRLAVSRARSVARLAKRQTIRRVARAQQSIIIARH